MAAAALSERLRFMELFRLAVSILRKNWERSLARSPQPFTPLSCRPEGGATANEAVNFIYGLNVLNGQKFYELMRESFPERSLRRRLQTFDLPPSLMALSSSTSCPGYIAWWRVTDQRPVRHALPYVALRRTSNYLHRGDFHPWSAPVLVIGRERPKAVSELSPAMLAR